VAGTVEDRRFVLTRRAVAESVAPMRNAVVAFAEEAGAVPDLLDAVKLATSEVLTNVVVHAYVDAPLGAILVEAWARDACLFVVVCDDGCGMRPRPDSPGLGLGLPLVAHMADDFRVEDRADRPGTRVAMRFSLDGSGLS
jgi:serine/threonine-protein kinase RsbW